MRTARLLGLVALALWALASGCREKSTAPSKQAACVPKVLAAKRGTPLLDGGLDQPVWHGAKASDSFIDMARDRPVPHTEARASWDDGSLFLTLYVADDDLHATDHVRVEFDADRTIEVSPDRKLRCRFAAESDCAALGIQSAFHVDGDVDATAEEDEEWEVTLSVPWSRLAPNGRPAELPISFRREDSVNQERLRLVWSRTCGAIRLE